jgi:beta-lactamase regulating signal transducer with metallopeptidase domain
MTHPAILSTPVVVETLGWALLHFVWQGAALAAALSVLMVCCRRAVTRYALGVGALVLLVAAPVITFLLLLPHPRPYVAGIEVPSGTASLAWVQATITRAPAVPAAARLQFQSNGLLWLVELWFAGVALFGLRATGGFFLIERLKRRGVRPVSSALCERCQALQRQLGIDRAVRFCETRLLAAPSVIGLFRPILLLPVSALAGLSQQQLEAVIAHELAHIRRLDPFVNLFQVTAETLLFYHPAVWWVSRRIRAERENCCDDEAIRAGCNAIDYARALTWMEERRIAPALALSVNSAPLAARVLRLLGLEEIRGGLRGASVATGVLCLAGALVAGSAFWGVARASFGLPTPPNQSAAIHHASSVASSSALNNRSILRSSETAASPAQASNTEGSSGRQNTGDERSSSAGQGGIGGFIEQMRAAGLKDLTVDQLIALKTQGVTPEYVRQMHALGLNLSVEELIAMRVQGVTPQYVQDMRATGLKLTADQLVGMKVQGVGPEYVRGMHDLGFQAEPDELIGMRVQGVTPEYVKEMRATGLKLSADQLIGMRVQGVTPEYVRGMHDLGFQAEPDELIGMRVQGVTPEYVKEMRATGLKPSADQLIGMRVQGVTPEYVRGMHDLGFQADPDALVGMRVQGVTAEYVKDMRAVGLKLTADQLVAMRVQGITPDYVKSLQAAGLKNLSGDDYIGAKVQGITPEFVEKARQQGFQNLTLDKLIQLKLAGVL